MRFVFINHDYPDFLRWLYASNPGLETRSYAEQMEVRSRSLFGTADFYTRNLRKLGHEACDFHVNNAFLQSAWAKEHGLRVPEASSAPKGKGLGALAKRWIPPTALVRLKPLLGPLARRFGGRPSVDYAVLEAQIAAIDPDVVFNQSVDLIDPEFLRGLKKRRGRLLVGQVATALSGGESLSAYDLLLSSLPIFVEDFRRRGVRSRDFPFSFEPEILAGLGPPGEIRDVTFVGSLSAEHADRIRLLERVATSVRLDVWGPGVEGLPAGSPLRAHHHGPAWGTEMYRILRDSRITINQHGRIAGKYAANMRLFEATGAGALLLTDAKENLPEFFEVGRELLAYRAADDCVEQIRRYLAQPRERDAVAAAGQARVLKDHTCLARMKLLLELLREIR